MLRRSVGSRPRSWAMRLNIQIPMGITSNRSGVNKFCYKKQTNIDRKDTLKSIIFAQFQPLENFEWYLNIKRNTETVLKNYSKITKKPPGKAIRNHWGMSVKWGKRRGKFKEEKNIAKDLTNWRSYSVGKQEDVDVSIHGFQSMTNILHCLGSISTEKTRVATYSIH